MKYVRWRQHDPLKEEAQKFFYSLCLLFDSWRAMKPYITSIFLFQILLSACGNIAVADPVTVTASPYNTPSPYPTLTAFATTTTPAFAPQPSATPFITVQKLPVCTFPLEGTPTEETVPEDYIFSEPRVVLAGPKKGFEIIEWLPNSKQALIVERVIVNGYEQYQSIQLFNPRTVKVQVYAQRDRASNQPPLWMEGLQAVIYPERRIVSWSFDENGVYIPTSLVERQLLWLSNGETDHTQNLQDVEYNPATAPHEQISFTLIAKPDGSRIVSLEGDGAQLLRIYQREVIQGSLGTKQLIPLNVPSPDNPDEPGLLNRLTRMAWQPSTSHVLFYNYVSPTDPTFLLNVDTGQACGLELGGWVYLAHWSPNGRYLAVIKSRGAKIPFTLDYDLVVLDALTGKFYQVDAKKLSPPDMMDIGVHKVISFAWAPDNRHIAAVGSVSFTGTSPPPSTERLFLADFLSGQIDPLFPSYEFDGQCSSFWGTGLAWSPDGSKLLAACTEIRLISVQKK